jgi:hypothetical protein
MSYTVHHRGIIVFIEPRVSVPSLELDPPTPACECVSPLDPKGDQHLLVGEEVGKGPIRATGKKAWHSVYCMLYVKIGYWTHALKLI